MKLFDTAGLRKRARVEDKLEKLSVADALRAIRFAEVVVVLLDATIPFEKQDLTIVDLIESEGRALVIGLNKWDLCPRSAVHCRLARGLDIATGNRLGLCLQPFGAAVGGRSGAVGQQHHPLTGGRY